MKGLWWHLLTLLNHEQGLDNFRRARGAWLEHIRQAYLRECFFTGRSLRPSHPQIFGAWVAAAARWLNVVNGKEENTSSRIYSRVSFVSDAIQFYKQQNVCNHRIIKCSCTKGCLGQCLCLRDCLCDAFAMSYTSRWQKAIDLLLCLYDYDCICHILRFHMIAVY